MEKKREKVHAERKSKPGEAIWLSACIGTCAGIPKEAASGKKKEGGEEKKECGFPRPERTNLEVGRKEVTAQGGRKVTTS